MQLLFFFAHVRIHSVAVCVLLHITTEQMSGAEKQKTPYTVLQSLRRQRRLGYASIKHVSGWRGLVSNLYRSSVCIVFCSEFFCCCPFE